ncbi:MAG TPA: zf-HC2 domain-containing protein [Pirellulales bacterium]|jgi:anti-sigma factor RsiW|nr:zf-HC2 domain-containing protein [Pirellulales bacterium]
MTCKEVNEFLVDYLDGSLPWRQRLSLNVHLMICRHCRQYLASYAATVRLTKSLGQVIEQPVPDELVRAILRARRAPPPATTEDRPPGTDS